MNQLLLKESPAPGATVTVTGARAEHIRTVLRSKSGDTLKAGVLGGLSGHGMIRSVEKGKVLLDSFVLDSPPPPPLPITLAVALPRPQSLKKVLHFASSAGIPELILFTLDQSAAQQTQKFQIPADFKQQYFIPENAEDLVFVEYPMRNARVLSFQIPEKDSGKILKMIHTHLLARQWQPGKQEKLMTEAVPQEEKKDVGRNTSEPEEEPLAPVYYQDREQKLLLLFYRIENNICRFSYYERPLEN